MPAKKQIVTPRRLTAPREPRQERSRVRVQALLDATKELLSERDFGEIGIYDIAERAKVQPSSAYHFLPTPEAAFLALARQYLLEQRAYVYRPFDHSRIMNWPDLIDLRYSRAVEFFNNNPAYGRLFLSRNSADIRKADDENVDEVSAISYDWLNQYVVMPYLPNHQVRYMVLISIWDGIWTTSYVRHGVITETYAHEGRQAGLAYCRTFLPEVLPLRESLKDE
jgi:AcrR family transcriptional regulator